MPNLAAHPRPMNILMIGSQMALAGAQRVLLSQASWFHARGHKITVVFFYDKQGLKEHWDQIYPFPVIDLQAWDLVEHSIGRYFRLIRGLLRLFQIFRKGNFDVVEAFTPHSNMLVMIVAAVAGVPVRIATHHGKIDRMSRVLHRLHGAVINSPLTTRMVAVSEQVREMSARLDGVVAGKVVVIHNGIEILPRPKDAEAIRLRIFRELGLTADTIFLLSVGRLSYEKGHSYLVDAASPILKKHPRVVFAIAGVGNLELPLREQAGSLGVADKIHFLGNRASIFDFYTAADIFIMPSIWEGMPISMLEAMSQHLPVIVSGVQAAGQVLVNEKTGLLIPSRDASAIVNAVDRMLSNPEWARKLGLAGAEAVRSGFSLDTMCAAYLDLFSSHLPD